MRPSILKNSAWLFFAQSLVKIVSFFYTIFLARNLGVGEFGLYVTALAYFALLSSISDFGINRFVIREGAKDPAKLPLLITLASMVRVALVFFIFLVFVLWLSFLDRDITRISLSLLAALAIFPQSVALTFDAALIAKERLKYSAMGLLGLSLATTILGVYFIHSGLNSLGAVLALFWGQMAYLVLLFLLLRFNNLQVNFGLWKSGLSLALQQTVELVKGSLPYGIVGVLGLLYFRVDTLMVSYLKSVEQAGFYGAAYRFLEAIVFVPSALASAMFPVLAKLHDHDLVKVKKLYFSSIKILGAFSLPVFLGYFFLLPKVITSLLPGYLPSIEAIKILSFAVPFIFIHVPGALVLISSDKFLKPVICLSIVTLSFNVILNFFFIPQFGFIGASYVTVLSEAFSFLVFFTLLYLKILRYA